MAFAVELDTGDLPSVLAQIEDPRTHTLAVYAVAERYVTDILDWIAAGQSFTPRSPGGGLEQAINWRPAGDGAEVYAQKDYAGYVEFGTEPHVIEPKPGRKGLKIPVEGGGGYIIRRRVNHPGSRPYPYFFADLEGRQERMVEAASVVIANRIV